MRKGYGLEAQDPGVRALEPGAREAPVLSGAQQRSEDVPRRHLSTGQQDQVGACSGSGKGKTVWRDSTRMGGAVERIGDGHALKAELASQERRRDRARPAGSVRTVVRVVDRIREHDQRDAGAAVGQEAGREPRAGAGDANDSAVGVRGSEPQAREVLHGRERVRVGEAEREGSGQARRSLRVE
jgi:hypothetical protein